MFNIVIVSGSTRLDRQTPKGVNYLVKVLKEQTKINNVQVLDVKKYNFPIMEERRGMHPNPPERLDEFGDALNNADAIVFASPEYNGSFSGALKNTLDHFRAEYKRKPIGVMTVSAGRFAGVNASHDLQKYILALGGYPMPLKLMIAQVQQMFDETGNAKEDWLTASFQKFVEELIWFTEAIHNQKQKE